VVPSRYAAESDGTYSVEAQLQSGTDLLDSFTWLPIPHFVETAAYDQAIQ